MKSEQEIIAEQAAEWVVKLSTDQCGAEDLAALEQWKQQSPEHLHAFEKLDRLIRGVQSLQQHNIDSQHPIIQDKVLGKKSKLPPHFSAFILLLLFCGLLYALPWQFWTADVKNQAQAWQQQMLDDSSTIQASGKTVYNIEYTAQQRTIALLQGNILIDVAKDANRPFVVKVGHSTIQALGTRFIVQHRDNLTIVSMLESKTRINASEESQSFILKTGQTLNLNHGKIIVEENSPDVLSQAWESKKLVVNNMPLDQVLQILASYQNSYYVYSKENLQQFKVTAVLPLDQPEVALQLLSEHIGLEISKYSQYITSIKKN
ncbi:FecR family protein [Acinetobacter populi]|uniref:FecR protein domain-containing protein n=1 Tax=Acinetobacter populi TaxID=1582270 RepID=A0A1Z9YZA4_9GAMM|nr:FecR domain-containing protein [Acinetobacter populi]OUY07538.1 hypothetical protein CAP51_07250 [Acinetobacter populi]